MKNSKRHRKQVSSKITSEVKQFDNIIKNPLPKDSTVETKIIPMMPKDILVPPEIVVEKI